MNTSSAVNRLIGFSLCLALVACSTPTPPPATLPPPPPPATATAIALPPTITDTPRADDPTTTPLTPTLTPSPTFPPPSGPPHIVLVIVDSLRADHLSSYGYPQATTPRLDALIAAQGVRFTQATSSAPWTCPANAALFSGLAPTRMHSTWTTMNHALPDSVQSLPEHLQAAGYLTAGFVTNACVDSRRGFAQGFAHFDDTLAHRERADSANKGRAPEVNALLDAWLTAEGDARAAAGQPLFLLTYYMEPHVWYTPPAPYAMLFDATYTGTVTSERYGVGQDVVEGRLALTPRDTEHVIALYDGEIAYWDAYFGELMAMLERHGLLTNTLIVVTSDHGEMFGEHNTWVHGSGLYEEEIHVPLLMRYTGVLPANVALDTPVQSFDLMPTLLAFAGAPVPTDLEAVSLYDLARGTAPLAPRDIYSELDAMHDPEHWAYWIAPRDDLRAIRRADWKLIHHVDTPANDELFHLLPSAPYEAANLATSEPAQLTLLRTQVTTWFGLPAPQ